MAGDIGHDGHTHILILHNEDRPGRIGAVGSTVGEMGANISSMDVGRQDATAGASPEASAPGSGGRAIMVLTVDRQLTPDELANLAAIPGIEDVKQAVI